jgi:hypothetical protein
MLRKMRAKLESDLMSLAKVFLLVLAMDAFAQVLELTFRTAKGK